MNNFFNQKVTAYVEKVTAYVGIAYTRLKRTFSKSHGSIIDNLADYSDDKKYTHLIQLWGARI
jgi:hypothetical protein